MIRLRRTGFPDTLRGEPGGTPFVSYWFEHDGHDFGVSKAVWDNGLAQWEILHAATLGTVIDDLDTLRQVRKHGAEECALFLADLRAEADHS